VSPNPVLDFLPLRLRRLDVHNGLLLSALWDAAFDAGLVSFAYDGTVLASPELSAAARTVLGIEKAPEPLDLGRLRPTRYAPTSLSFATAPI
jgi:hypothetical protein